MKCYLKSGKKAVFCYNFWPWRTFLWEDFLPKNWRMIPLNDTFGYPSHGYQVFMHCPCYVSVIKEYFPCSGKVWQSVLEEITGTAVMGTTSEFTTQLMTIVNFLCFHCYVYLSWPQNDLSTVLPYFFPSKTGGNVR